MEPQPDLSKVSTRKLRCELERWEKRRDILQAEFPRLVNGTASLIALYLKPDGSHCGGPEWDKHAEAGAQIRKLKLELIRRDQPLNSPEDAAKKERAGKPASAASKPAEATATKSWSEIEIAFLSDERVEICSGGSRKTYNYAELGFADRRNGKPNRAWVMLRELAKCAGALPTGTTQGKQLAQIQKRIEEIREKFRSHFGIESDPIPFNGTDYQTSFKIDYRASFNT